MQNDERDWLDERLAAQDYLPDDGFTGRVVGLLPKMRARAAELLRWRILFISALLSTCLLAVQIMPLARGINQMFLQYSPMETVGQLSRLLQQPDVIFGGAAGIVILGFASIPLLRRWA